MKKITLPIFIMALVLFAGCAQNSLESKLREEIKDMGYDIVEYDDEIFTMEIMSKDQEYKEISKAIFWEVQEFALSKYEGKNVDYHIFRVKNHPIDQQQPGVKLTEIRLGVIDGEIIGGFTSPYKKDELFLGGPTAIDGRTLEELTGMTYIQWANQWSEEYEVGLNP